MYRCEICRAVAERGKPKLVARVLRADGSIARELGVCAACNFALHDGETVITLIAKHRTPAPAEVAPFLPERVEVAKGRKATVFGQPLADKN